MVFGYHLHQWQRHGDIVLADLCRRFLDRDLLKAIEVSRLSADQQQQLLAQMRDRLANEGWVGPYYSGLRQTWSRGYTLYQRGILLHQDDQLIEINQASPLIQTLTRPQQRIWLLYPRQFEAWVRQQCQASLAASLL
jgi:hypothetical protein